MRKRWDIHLVPGSHFDYGWAASPGECFSYLTEVIRTAVEDMLRYPELKFTIEYVLFARHFLSVYPEYLGAIKRLLKEGRLEVCTTMSGAIEQWLDGEMLIHQLAAAKRWVRKTLDYDPITAQHTDLPGHVLQIAQFLRLAEIGNLAYSRYHPPSPLHRWRSPDGSEVVACCHQHETNDYPSDWSGYGWGWSLFVKNRDMEVIQRDLPADLERRDRCWPKAISSILMGCQSDLQPIEPGLIDRVRQWNDTHPDARIRISTISEFFRNVDAERIPVYQGEAPYAFFCLPSIYIPCAQALRTGENALAAAEKWSVFAQLAGLGRAPKERIERARDATFLPHDHNTAGRRGEVNDAERVKDALHFRLEGESILQEKAMSFTVNIAYRSLKDGVYPITVFNGLSWDRTDVVETYIEIPMTGVRGLHMFDCDGKPVASQIVRGDERSGSCRLYLVFIARKVPAHGYRTFYVRPSREPENTDTSLRVTAAAMRNRFFEVSIRRRRVQRVLWNGTDILGTGPRRFNEIYMLEDRMSNVEAGPWEVDQTYTGKEWSCRMTKTEVIEQGPVRAIVRFYGRIRSTRFMQDVILYDALERIDLRQRLEYRMRMHTMTRVAYPFNVPAGQATYESPYGAVRIDKDEMPNTFRGRGERWVQKWIDVSNADYGITLATRQVSHAIREQTVEPILVRTALDCGTVFHYYDQNETFTFDHAVYPHKRNWKQAASHRAGWEFNSPLYSCNWTPCFPIKPLRLSRDLPECDRFLEIDRKNVVVTAVKPSHDDEQAFLVRLVEFHGKGGPVRLTWKCPVADAKEVNFLEKPVGAVHIDGESFTVSVKPYGIHTVKVKLLPGTA